MKASKTPARKVVAAVSGEAVDAGATHAVLVTPKVDKKAFFSLEFSKGSSSYATDGSMVSGEQKMKVAVDATSLQEAAQELHSLVPRVLVGLTPEQFDESLRRAVAVRGFLLESMTLVATTLASAKEIVDTASQKFEWEQASHDKQLEAEFPGWKARTEVRIVREELNDESNPSTHENFLKWYRKDVRGHLSTAVEALKAKGWDEAQLMELQDTFEECETEDELRAFSQTLVETVVEAAQP